jgi:hypothetical protein
LALSQEIRRASICTENLPSGGHLRKRRRGAHPAQGDFSKDLNRIYIFGKSTMSEFMHEHSTRVKDQDGTTYIVRVYAQERTDGTWAGWIEFHPIDERKPVLRTGQETSQPNRAAIEYWTLGLEPVYFDGAFARAHGRLP